jgi:hypothetical protein
MNDIMHHKQEEAYEIILLAIGHELGHIKTCMGG